MESGRFPAYHFMSARGAGLRALGGIEGMNRSGTIVRAAGIVAIAITTGGAYSASSMQTRGAVGADGAASPRPLIATYCTTCHNQRLRTGGLSLDAVDIDHAAADPAVWEKVIHKLRSGQMPPAGRPRPDRPAIDAFVSQVERALDEAAAKAPDPGRPVTHRLTRTEYANAVRDLLAVE